MRTLLFCTAYAATPSMWQLRYRRWLDAVRAAQLGADQVLIVDDGSPVMPDWGDITVSSGEGMEECAQLAEQDGAVLFHFENRLGRQGLLHFPGWYRSFAFAGRYAAQFGFDRVIHIESDAYLVSERMRGFVRDQSQGWVLPWCPAHQCPEICVQVIGADQIGALAEFCSQPYENLAGQYHEWAVPATMVDMRWQGDRFGQTDAQVPVDADFACQISPQREPGFYWWLRSRPGPGAAPPVVHYIFGWQGNAKPPHGDGWGEPEPELQWMVGTESVLTVPQLPEGSYEIAMRVMPYVRPSMPAQRLEVFLNNRRAGEFALDSPCVIGCGLPPDVLRKNGPNSLRFVHPDAASPASVESSPDDRMLAVALQWLRVSGL